MKLLKRKIVWIALVLCIPLALFTVERWRKRSYSYDYNKDGKNWYDYKRKIDALEFLVSEQSVEGRREWRGGMYFHLAMAYEDISVYYDGKEKAQQITEAINAMQDAGAWVEHRGVIRAKLAQYRLEIGDIDEGIKILEGHAVSLEDFLCLSKLYEEKGDYEKAIDSLSKAIEIRDSIAVLYFELGRLYEIVDETENASNNYRLALQYLPKKEEYLANSVGQYLPVEGQKGLKILTEEEGDRQYDALRRKYEQAYKRAGRSEEEI